MHVPSEAVPANLAELAADGAAGILWRLREEGRQLDANLVRLGPGQRIGTHAEPDLDVLLVVISGEATLTTGDGDAALTAGSVTWLTHGCARSVAAGPAGVAYLTVHRRRPGLRIGVAD